MGHLYYLCLVIFYLIWRLAKLKRNEFMIWTVVIVLLVSFRALFANFQAIQQTPHTSSEGNFTVYVPPDSWRIDGNLATATALDQTGRHRLRLSLLLKQRRQQQYLKQSHHYERIVVDGYLQSIMPATNENNFDAQKYYAHQGIYQQVQGEIKKIQAVNAPVFLGELHC